MARQQGIFGGLQGKVGGVVFAKGEDGQTIARPYVSNPKNPRTPAQLRQRAKVNMAGRLSAITPASLIKAYGMSAVKNRSAFTRNIINSSTVTVADGNYTASIDAADVKFSHGSVQPLASHDLDGQSISDNIVTVNMNMTDPAAVGTYGERLVALAIAPDGTYKVINYVDWLPTAVGAANVDIPLYGVNFEEGDKVAVYRIPYQLTAQGRVNISTKTLVSVVDGSDYTIAADLDTTTGAGNISYGNTVFGGLLVNASTRMEILPGQNYQGIITIDGEETSGVDQNYPVGKRIVVVATPSGGGDIYSKGMIKNADGTNAGAFDPIEPENGGDPSGVPSPTTFKYIVPQLPEGKYIRIEISPAL